MGLAEQISQQIPQEEAEFINGVENLISAHCASVGGYHWSVDGGNTWSDTSHPNVAAARVDAKLASEEEAEITTAWIERNSLRLSEYFDVRELLVSIVYKAIENGFDGGEVDIDEESLNFLEQGMKFSLDAWQVDNNVLILDQSGSEPQDIQTVRSKK